MTALSGRYAVVLLVILIVALVPMTVGTLRPHWTDDCADAEAMRDLAAIGWPGEFADRERRPGSGHLQWSEASVPLKSVSARGAPMLPRGRKSGKARAWRLARETAASDDMEVRVVRSFNPFYLRQRSTAALGLHLIPDTQFVERRETSFGDLVVHVMRKHDGFWSEIAAYTYIFDGRSVETPILAELAGLPSTLWNGVRPLTVLIAYAKRPPGEFAPAEAEAIDWVTAAWDRYQRVCRM